MININEFREYLLKSLPEFKVKYDEILKDNDGEIMTYLIFGELTRFFIEEYRKGNLKLCNKIQIYLESLLEKNDSKMNELVSFGFLENLHQADGDYEKIKTTLRPILLKELEMIENN